MNIVRRYLLCIRIGTLHNVYSLHSSSPIDVFCQRLDFQTFVISELKNRTLQNCISVAGEHSLTLNNLPNQPAMYAMLDSWESNLQFSRSQKNQTNLVVLTLRNRWLDGKLRGWKVLLMQLHWINRMVLDLGSHRGRSSTVKSISSDIRQRFAIIHFHTIIFTDRYFSGKQPSSYSIVELSPFAAICTTVSKWKTTAYGRRWSLQNCIRERKEKQICVGNKCWNGSWSWVLSRGNH